MISTSVSTSGELLTEIEEPLEKELPPMSKCSSRRQILTEAKLERSALKDETAHKLQRD